MFSRPKISAHNEESLLWGKYFFQENVWTIIFDFPQPSSATSVLLITAAGSLEKIFSHVRTSLRNY